MDHKGQPAINNQQRTILNWALSAMIGLAVGASCAIRVLKTPLLSPFVYVTAGFAIGLVYLVLTRLIQPAWPKWLSYIRLGMLGASILLATAIVFNSQRPSGIYWQRDTDPYTWQPVVSFRRLAWGRSVSSVLDLHPTDRPDGSDTLYGPWRITTNLDGVFDGVAKRLSFKLTQPEWGIIDQQTGQIVQEGGDGVTVVFKVERAGAWQTVQQVHLDLIAHPDQRHWHTVEMEVPADSQRLAIEALPGPPGSNIFFDSVWVSLERISPTGSRSLAPLLSIVDLIALSFLWLSGLVLIFRLVEKLNRSGFFAPEEITGITGADERLVFGYLVPVLAISLSFVWIALDKSLWGGDQAWYGIGSLELFHTLIHSPSKWAFMMLNILQAKAPGIVWIGQFFVPLGYLVGSIDMGLLFSILVTQALGLMLMYRSIWKLSKGKLLVAVIGCLVIASAPLFVWFSHQYYVEPMQTLAVAWFVLIMSFAPRWSRAFISSQLLAATCFAMLAKASSPLYCLGPGLVALAYAFLPKQTSPGRWYKKHTLVTLAFGMPLSLATTAWYYLNMELVIFHVSVGSSGPIAELWGKKDTFLNTMIYWLGVVQSSFFLPGVLVLGMGIFVSGVIYYFKSDKPMKHFTVCGAISVLQIIMVLSAFSLNSNREFRYILPLLPYFAILICWSVAQINRPILTGLAIVIFTAQLAITHGIALGIIQRNPSISPFAHTPFLLLPANSDTRNAAVLNSIVSRTCTKASRERYWNIIGAEKGWLNPVIANYVAAKNLAPHELPRCYYDYLGGSFYGSSANNAWELMLSRGIRYYITTDPDLYPVPSKVLNQALNQHNFPIILEKVQTSDLFEPEPPLAEDPGILIFRRIDYVLGRELSDQGEHEQAIEILRKATSLEPSNDEAWANLGLAYDRQGRQDEAISAYRQVLKLNPDHYWAIHLLAHILYGQEQWADVTSLEQRAVKVAPDDQQRAASLTLLARAYYQLGDTARACNLFRQAYAIQQSQEILDMIEALECPD